MLVLIFLRKKRVIAFQETRNETSIEKINSNISKIIGADFTAYNDTTALAEAIGIPEDQLCFTCSTGDYSSLGIKPIFRTRKEMKGEE